MKYRDIMRILEGRLKLNLGTLPKRIRMHPKDYADLIAEIAQNQPIPPMNAVQYYQIHGIDLIPDINVQEHSIHLEFVEVHGVVEI